MIFTSIRHATCIIEFAGIKFLIDPILYKKETLDPTKGGIDKKNPLVDVTVNDEILKNIDVILLTHTHRDHFDPSIFDFFGKSIPLVCSAEYEELLSGLGFDNLHLVKGNTIINNVEITLTKGRHGTGVVRKLMGNSYGFVLKAQEEDTLYITGDTVWCKCVESTIDTHSPKYIIAFAGSAMINNQHVTMDEKDISMLLNKAPDAKIIAIHMEAWNHCRLMRCELESVLKSENLLIPKDGETINQGVL